MKQITLSGELYNVHSPSLFCLVRHPLWITFNGRTWQIGYFGAVGTWSPREFPSRQAAAELVAQAFTEAEEAVR